MVAPERDAVRLDVGSVIGKLDAILEALVTEDDGLPLTELVRRTGLPKSTVHRLCRILTARGVVEHAQEGYQLGVRLFELGARAPRRRHLCDQARPHLEDLVTQTRSAVHLVLLEGLDALVLEHLTAPGHGARGSDVGCRLPLHCSAAGRALLAHGPGDLVRQVLARGLPRRTPRTDTTAAGLARALERARARGVAVEVEELALGYVAVGAPVLDPAGRVAAAVSATVPTHAADVGLLARRVTGAATAIAAALAVAGERPALPPMAGGAV